MLHRRRRAVPLQILCRSLAAVFVVGLLAACGTDIDSRSSDAAAGAPAADAEADAVRHDLDIDGIATAADETTP